MRDNKSSKRARLAKEDENRQLGRYISESREIGTYKMTEAEHKAAKERRIKIRNENKAKAAIEKKIRQAEFAVFMEGVR